MKNLNLKRMFDSFLKENDAYEQYYEHLRMDDSRERWVGPHKIEDFFDLAGPENYIQFAFFWQATPEGHSFWDDLGWSWRHFYRSMPASRFKVKLHEQTRTI